MNNQPMVSIPLEDLLLVLAVLHELHRADLPHASAPITVNYLIDPGIAVAYDAMESAERKWNADHPESA